MAVTVTHKSLIVTDDEGAWFELVARDASFSMETNEQVIAVEPAEAATIATWLGMHLDITMRGAS